MDRAGKGARGMTPHQVITVASLIETETGVASERPIVASVIYNRLKKGIPLGIDQTAVYIAKMEGRWDGTINRSDLDSPSPYNTRKRSGLPPGPISSVSESSIQAALNPAQSDYLYYVRNVQAKRRLALVLFFSCRLSNEGKPNTKRWLGKRTAGETGERIGKRHTVTTGTLWSHDCLINYMSDYQNPIPKPERSAILIVSLLMSIFVVCLFVEEAVYQYNQYVLDQQMRSKGISFSNDDWGRRSPAGLLLLVPMITLSLIRPKRFWISAGLTFLLGILFGIGCYLRLINAIELNMLNPVRNTFDFGDYLFGFFLLVMTVWQISILKRIERPVQKLR
jgi:hypothetical protein